jgi:cytochrome d ubiquinol oxidase subunit II
MTSYADLTAGVMLIALIVYAVTGGADFGGGLWHMLASGPRAKEQRLLIDDAIAPIWEANHVWLILIVVLLFVCFPHAFAAASIALHIPLTVMLIGIVLRGAGFAFRHYAATRAMRRRWSRLFAASSVLTPVFLGICLGAITAGTVVVHDGVSLNGFVASWLHVFPLAVGGFTLALFAMISAVYLANEAHNPDVADDFRLRAIVSAVAVGVFAAAAIALAPPVFRAHLIGSRWSWPLQILTACVALGLFAALFARRYPTARLLVIAQTTLILMGWALAHYPMLIAPELTIEAAAAPPYVMRITLTLLVAGTAVLAPSFYYLFRVFKGQEGAT